MFFVKSASSSQERLDPFTRSHPIKHTQGLLGQPTQAPISLAPENKLYSTLPTEVASQLCNGLRHKRSFTLFQQDTQSSDGGVTPQFSFLHRKRKTTFVTTARL